MRNAALAIVASLCVAGGAALAQAAPSDPLLESGQLSVRAEALLWWFKDSPNPVPLITDGRLGDANTHVLLGGDDLRRKRQNGLRLTAIYGFNDRASLELGFLAFGTRAVSRGVESSGLLGSTDLLLPYFDVTRNRENVTEISFSPVYGGSAREELTRSMLGAEVNWVRACGAGRPGQVELLGGLRWLGLRETFTFTTSSPFTAPAIADVWNTTDRFDARNNFYGAQVGARARFDRGRFFATGAVKIGVGAIVQKVDVDGFLETNDFTNFEEVERFTGGYFALPSNIGSHKRTRFAVLPEAQAGVGFQFAPWVAVFAGYSFLYTNDVVRPGEQINRNINPTQSVSWVGEPPPPTPQKPTDPAFEFHGSSFWAHGINAGVSFRF